MKDQPDRRSYHAPEVTAYGRLETITALIGCDFNKIGSSPDDVQQFVTNIHGDTICT